jgi:hypothetical protein
MSTRNVITVPEKACAITNCMYVSEEDELLNTKYIKINGYVFNLLHHPLIPFNSIGMGNIHRQLLRVAVRDNIDVFPFIPLTTMPKASIILIKVSPFTDRTTSLRVNNDEINAEEFACRFLKSFEQQILAPNQQIAFEYESGKLYRVTISCILDVERVVVEHAYLYTTTKIETATSIDNKYNFSAEGSLTRYDHPFKRMASIRWECFYEDVDLLATTLNNEIVLHNKIYDADVNAAMIKRDMAYAASHVKNAKRMASLKTSIAKFMEKHGVRSENSTIDTQDMFLK